MALQPDFLFCFVSKRNHQHTVSRQMIDPLSPDHKYRTDRPDRHDRCEFLCKKTGEKRYEWVIYKWFLMGYNKLNGYPFKMHTGIVTCL